MNIAIHAADLDSERIDGTRIYIHNCLKNFGLLNKRDQFLIYHKKKDFNAQLTPPEFSNYKVIRLRFLFCWTQTRFAWEMRKAKPDALWMPMHSLPYLRSKKTKTVATIHDLAFKFFPDFFPRGDLRRLNLFTDYAIRNADRLIAVSNSTKNDIMKLYPGVEEDKIKVVYHGYDKTLFNMSVSQKEIRVTKAKYGISHAGYIIYVGAVQPRKNIGVLIDAFNIVRKKKEFEDFGLVIAGGLGWMYKDIIRKIGKAENVVALGNFKTEDLPALISGAEVFVLPSLYEGFGLPVLEAMACGTPVIAADNSSLREVAGDGGLLFNARDSMGLAEILFKILKSGKLKNELRAKGLRRVKKFSWEKCARETLECLTEW